MNYSIEDLFRIKQKFLMQTPHPKVFLKYINDLKSENQSFEELLKSFNDKKEKIDLIVALEDYLKKESKLKLEVANAKTSDELAKSLQNYLNSLLVLMFQLALCDKGYEAPPEFKLSSPIPVYEIVKSGKSIKNLTIILDSREKSLAYSKENPKFAILIENILRSKLILNG